MNCREALENLYAYLDGQLDDDTVERIQGHLEVCDHCFEAYEFERLLQDFVVRKGQVIVRTEPLKSKVMDKIRELDQEDEGASGFFFVVRPYLAAAAAIVITLVGLYFYLGDSSSTLYASFVDCHLKCNDLIQAEQQQPVSPAQIDSCLSHIAVFPARFMKGDEHRIPTFGEVNQYGGEDAAHFVFSYHGSLISVFIVDQNKIDPSGSMDQTTDDRHTYFHSQEEDFNIVMWKCNCAWCVAISCAETGKIIEFASAY